MERYQEVSNFYKNFKVPLVYVLSIWDDQMLVADEIIHNLLDHHLDSAYKSQKHSSHYLNNKKNRSAYYTNRSQHRKNLRKQRKRRSGCCKQCLNCFDRRLIDLSEMGLYPFELLQFFAGLKSSIRREFVVGL